MIKIIAGGKKNSGAYAELINEYEKRLKNPFQIEWKFVEEEKLVKKLEKWPFNGDSFVICCDERGKNISSDEYSTCLSDAFLNSRDVVILIGGAYGFSDEIRNHADLVWSFSRLVFPHQLFRIMVVEQIYRAQEISLEKPYHHK